MRFYYRFIHPNQHLIEQGLHDWLWQLTSEQLRAFIGTHAFEELCQEWILTQARSGQLPIIPERVGSHWAPDAQIDVVAINWRLRQILLGEAKWTGNPINRKIVRDLIAKTPLVVPDEGEGWQVHYAFFSRSGFTEAAVAEAQKHEAILVDLDVLGEVLRREARQVALRELAQLDEQQRQVVLLKIIQGMTLREVAEVVGVSVSLVNYRLNQGLKELAQRLKKAGVV